MRVGLVALVVAAVGSACAYTPQAGEVDADGPTSDDAMVGADAGDGPAPTYQVIETMVVDSASPTPTRSLHSLALGVTYHLRVSGVITNVIDQFQGDADYFDFDNPRDDGCCEDIGLGIDDLVVDDKDTKPNWGAYRADHTYEVEWVGEGRPIDALFQDTFYGNNIGDLTLEILELR